MDFAEKTVWITGASSGIGEALAYELARRGARLILSARREEKLRAVQAACAHPERHRIVPLDLAEPDSIGEAARRVLAEGVPDVLVNNGGISQRSRVAETRLAVDRRIMEVNYFGTIALTKAVLPGMLARGSGHLVTISSLVGKFGTPKRSAYAASKHALHGFFDALRAETYDAGIRITMVCPGFVRTAVSENALTADGTPHGVMDPSQRDGLAPEACARRIARAVEKEKAEVYIGGRETVAVYLTRYVPALFRRVIRRVQR